jgi:hypothetical protein
MKYMRTRFFSFVISCLLLTGCLSNYQLGSTLPPDIRSVYIPIAENLTEEPLLADEVTRAVLAQMQRDGSLEIENQNTADTVLYVRITDFTLQPLAYDSGDRLRGNEYRLRLVAEIELIRQSNGQTLARADSLRGRSEFELTGDLTSGKRQGTPDAAEDLARRIVATVTEAWPD